MSIGCVAEARDNLTRDGKPATHGQMVGRAELWVLGFAVRPAQPPVVARPAADLPGEGIQRNSIALQLDDFRALRNRMAHYEPIVALRLAQRYADITTLTG